ncbi:MAG TPA: pre-peptidase C-terminal domain-containing protein, partial [Tepidisphaeraceae bacterium]|nr:pre-peptidase C-terminal domain-containing protein [Tepidisphaeraceae bacterium]
NTNYTLALTADYAGNTLGTSRNVGAISGSLRAGDFIGQSDPNDYYRFAINSPQKITATLSTLSSNVGLQLISDSNHDGLVESTEVLAASTIGTAGGSIQKTLAPGVYYVRVYQAASDSNYHLTISATTPPANLHIVLNYQYDSSGFFATHPDAVARLNQAAAMFSVFSDQLTALTPGSGNTWQEQFDNPTTGRLVSVNDPVVAANSVVIYVGASSGLQALELGEGAPGGWTATGSETWLQDVEARGQVCAMMGHPTDFGPWGGSISFSRFTHWNFSANSPASGAEDFLSVAIHEIAHVLGFGTSDSWNTYSSAGTFTGPHAELANAGKPVLLSSDSAHWADGSKSAVGSAWQACMMDPYLPAGQRRTLTQLDFAGLEDVGWQLG